MRSPAFRRTGMGSLTDEEGLALLDRVLAGGHGPVVLPAVIDDPALWRPEALTARKAPDAPRRGRRRRRPPRRAGRSRRGGGPGRPRPAVALKRCPRPSTGCWTGSPRTWASRATSSPPRCRSRTTAWTRSW
ncbi:hypothetical protein O1L55_09695 [Streptomyces albulus]|nr:hypothetical protein [Streptomyces noursei]